MSKKDYIPKQVKKYVYARDGNKCRYCGDTKGPFHLDHVYPESKGGATKASNLVVACADCNRKKHARIGIWPMPIGKENEIRESEKRVLINSFYNLLILLGSIAGMFSFGFIFLLRANITLISILMVLSVVLFVIAYVYRIVYRRFFYWN